MQIWRKRIASWPYLPVFLVLAVGAADYLLVAIHLLRVEGPLFTGSDEWILFVAGTAILAGTLLMGLKESRRRGFSTRLNGLVSASLAIVVLTAGVGILRTSVSVSAWNGLPLAMFLLNPMPYIVAFALLLRRTFTVFVTELGKTLYERDGLSAVLAFSETTSLMDREAMVSEIITRSRDLTGADACLLYLFDREADVLRVVAHWHNPQVYEPDYVRRMVEFPCARGFGITGTVFESGEAELVKDTSKDPRRQGAQGYILEAKTSLIVPLKVRGKLLGVLRLSKRGVDQISETQVTVATIFAQHVAVALEASDLYREVYVASRTDHLTGLPNARAFYTALEREVACGRPCALLMIDADALKRVNDLLGHQAGDRMLIDLARALRRHAEEIGTAYRYAGDEFLVILPNCSKPRALAVAELVRSDLERGTVESSCGLIRTTVSIGVAGFPSDAADADSLLAAADRAMYHAKERGKNGICAAS